jgi:hypothetical protein
LLPASDSGPPDPTPEPTTDEFKLFQGDFISYTQLMSQMTLNPGAGTSGTQYEATRASSYDTSGLSTRVPEMQLPADARHERSRREIRSRDTYNPSLIRRMFCKRWCIFFISHNVVYICILFERLYFIFFIYGLKFNFSYLCFDINYLKNFQII